MLAHSNHIIRLAFKLAKAKNVKLHFFTTEVPTSYSDRDNNVDGKVLKKVSMLMVGVSSGKERSGINQSVKVDVGSFVVLPGFGEDIHSTQLILHNVTCTCLLCTTWVQGAKKGTNLVSKGD